MKPTLQAKLLRVLQEKEFEPVGGLQATKVDTRVLAATHCDLEQLVTEGTFREDLYYRLSVIPLNIPPLKSRKEDIPLLLESFIHAYTTERGRERFTFSDDALKALYEVTYGIPRRIGAACETALTFAMLEDRKTIDADLVLKAKAGG